MTAVRKKIEERRQMRISVLLLNDLPIILVELVLTAAQEEILPEMN